MATSKHKIFIAGAGGIGQAVGLLLREWAEFETDLLFGDINAENLRDAQELITANSKRDGTVEGVQMPKTGTSGELEAGLKNCEVLLDCSPGGEAPRMARFARDFGLHYANLTEYVAETDAIIEIAKDAKTGFILQTGLAPGFINVLAMSLYQQFQKQFGVEKVERVVMKVGALTAHAHAPHFYGFTWSPIGVATEYVKPSRVIRNYEITELPALSDREKIIIGGRTYEADLTSGGAADLPDFFAGKARNLEYKTLRHNGHYDWADAVIKQFPVNNELPNKILAEFLRQVPAVEDDFVLVHAAVDGFDDKGVRRMLEKAFFIEPLQIGNTTLRAIQTTTAAPLCESAAMLLTGKYKGVILQSQIEPEEFLHGNFVSRVYGTK
ncbi:MAG: saccharopine dehydrogenase C-terminal domain-containing protein [Pyrinomonadaceae bacterium]